MAITMMMMMFLNIELSELKHKEGPDEGAYPRNEGDEYIFRWCFLKKNFIC